MAHKDYYDILGVARSASADEIKRAYRKLARELHPDVNKAPDAQKKFTQVQSAYDTLSDEQKRKLYDQFGERYSEMGAGVGAAPGGVRWNTPGGSPDFQNFNLDADELSSMFEAMFGGTASTGRSSRTAGRTGRKARPAPRPETHHEITVPFMTAAKGGTETLRLESGGKKRTIEVNIPAGIASGAQLRIRDALGEGQGDLILTIRVGEHPLFRRAEPSSTGAGADIILELPLTIAEAALGATVTVPTLDGRVDLAVPAGSASGRRLRLRGQGLASTHGGRGDLIVLIKILPPPLDKLSDVDKAHIEALGRLTPNPRKGTGWDSPA